ncbi:MAG: YciI family protein [Roseimicrobium sp.]
MQYLMLIHLNAARWDKLSSDERNQIHADCGVWHEELVRSGKSIGAAALQPPSTATTLREENGILIVTDGPFAETREVLGGFETLECKDLDEALAIAKRFPAFHAGSAVEVRPLMTGPCVD